jgi:hypothetical protein
MSRAASGDVVIVKPRNNVYTVLVIVATLVNLAAFALMFVRYTVVFGDKANLFQMQ